MTQKVGLPHLVVAMQGSAHALHNRASLVEQGHQGRTVLQRFSQLLAEAMLMMMTQMNTNP